MRLLLIGNYGVGNLGDEALKEYFLAAFPDAEWTVVSARPAPGECPRLPMGIRSFLLPWWRTLRAYRMCDAVIFGGGSLFTDTESLFACVLWWWHACVTRFYGKPVYVAFQGIGPFRHRIGEWFTRHVVRMASFISVRDTFSQKQLNLWNLNTKIILTFDPVFTLFDKYKYNNCSKKVFILIPRLNTSATFRDLAVERARSGGFDAVRILSLQPESADEQRTCAQLARATGGMVVPIRSLDDLGSEVCAATFVLAQRYHGALAALALGRDFAVVPQREGDKLSVLRDLKGHEEQCRRCVREGEDALRGALRYIEQIVK